jgi:hypothetical protein
MADQRNAQRKDDGMRRLTSSLGSLTTILLDGRWSLVMTMTMDICTSPYRPILAFTQLPTLRPLVSLAVHRLVTQNRALKELAASENIP